MIEFKIGDIIKFNPNKNFSNVKDIWKSVIIECIKYRSTFIINSKDVSSFQISNYNNKVILPFEPFGVFIENMNFIKVGEIKQ